jgi:hypothetical protein
MDMIAGPTVVVPTTLLWVALGGVITSAEQEAC